MVKLKEKIANCYMQYLTNLTYGITTQDYKILYGAVLLVKNNIDNKKYIEYFINNLNCSGGIELSE